MAMRNTKGESQGYRITLQQLGKDRWFARNEDSGRQHIFELLELSEDTPDDIRTQLIQLYRKYMVELRAEKHIDVDAFLDKVKKPGHKIIMLIESNRVIGFHLSWCRDGLHVTLESIYVDKDYRGSGAVDVFFEDLRERFNVKKILWISLQIRRCDAPSKGDFEGEKDAVKRALYIRSTVTKAIGTGLSPETLIALGSAA